MNSLLILIGYEYKKIFKRKSTWIALFTAVFLVLLTCLSKTWGTVYVDGKPTYSHYEELTTDRAYAGALAGRNIDGELIREMQEAYRKVPDVPLYTATKEYQTYARPYSAIYQMVRSVWKDPEQMDVDSFYELRMQLISELFQRENLTDIEISKHLEKNSRIKTPFIFQYADGYDDIIKNIYTLGFTITFLIAICLAPVFANEYSENTDQVLLSARFGKNKAIHAKLITGISFGIFASSLLLVIMNLLTLFIYGFSGWNAPIQFSLISSTAPLSMLEGVMILNAMVIIASILISSLSIFLSAKLKSSYGVIIIISTFTILCMFLNVPHQYRHLLQLVMAFPANVMSSSAIFAEFYYVLFKQCFTTYQVVPVIYGVISTALLIFGYRSFKNHQIGV